jgi:hypothetical protein
MPTMIKMMASSRFIRPPPGCCAGGLFGAVAGAAVAVVSVVAMAVVVVGCGAGDGAGLAMG